MSEDDKKYSEGASSRAGGFSDVTHGDFSRKDSSSGSRSAPPRDAYDGFVPNMAAAATFTAEEAQAREGDYVLSLGLAGSGKSTFHSFLLRYIEQSGSLNHEMRIPRLRNGDEDHQTRLLLNQWRSTWNRGAFVSATAATESAIREIRYQVTPVHGVKAQLNFGLVEVAGELLKQVQGGRTGKQSLPEAVHHLIANPKVNLMVLMMVHPDTPDNDLLLTNFIDYLDQRFPGRRDHISLGIIIANPDRALEQLVNRTGGRGEGGVSSPFSHYQRLEDDAVFDYMKVMSPGVLSKWRAWEPKKRMITPLRLGDIETFQDDQGNETIRLTKPDYTHIGKIFDWMYFHFTGKRRGPTWFQRLIRDLGKSS